MNKKWTDDEVELLIKYYPDNDLCKLSKLITTKTPNQIRSKAKTLHLYRTRKKNIFCNKCGIKLNTNNSRYNKCNQCVSNEQYVTSYKKKYGIILDDELVLNTYDIIQWYKWTKLEKTPNGKCLTSIPNNLNNLKSISSIIRYVVDDILKWNTRNEKLQLIQPIMNKYKIGFSKTISIKNSPYKLLTNAYPELNFQEWEMVHSTCKYWQNYNNFLNCVKYYYDNFCIKDDENNIHSFFINKSVECLFPKLMRAKNIYYREKSWESILKDLKIHIEFPDNKRTTYNGIILDSLEETLIYDYIHNVLNIKTLKNIGNKRKGKYKFIVNNSQYKFFCPDFVIESFNNKKLNKPIIIEYYGLYYKDKRIGNTITNKIINEYLDKTHIKNKYYKNNSDIYFIDIYPTDLKNNFKGVRNKLTSFFMESFNINLLDLKEVS